MKILLVEDSDEQRSVFSLFLRTMGHEVVECCSAADVMLAEDCEVSLVDPLTYAFAADGKTVSFPVRSFSSFQAFGPRRTRDDFSGVDPLSAYTLSTPRSVGVGQSAMNILVDSEELVLRYVSGFGVAAAIHNDSQRFADSTIEADVRFDTTDSSIRSAMNIEWFFDSLNRYSLFVQHDVDSASLDFLVGGVNTRTSAPFTVDSNVTYRLRMETEGTSRVKGFIDDVMFFDVPVDLSGFPVRASPTLSGNAKAAPMDLRFDNLVVR